MLLTLTTNPQHRSQTRGVSLTDELRALPTLTICGNYNRKGSSPTSGDGLVTALRRPAMMATLTARDWRSGKASEATHQRNARPLSEQLGGLLHPDWCDWYQGMPAGWSRAEPASTPSAMRRFRSWLRRLGGY